MSQVTNSKPAIESVDTCPRCKTNDRVCKWKDYLCVENATRAGRQVFFDLRSADPIRAVSLGEDLALLLSDLRSIAHVRALAARDLRTLPSNSSIGKRTKSCFFKPNGFSEYFICDSKH